MKKILLGLVILMLASNAFAADLAITITKHENWGGSRITYGYITASATTYPSGGFAVSARDLRLSNVNNLTFGSVSSAVYSYAYDYTNGTIQVYYTDNGIGEPAVSPATADKFNVVNTSGADSTTGAAEMVWVSTNSSAHAFFGTMKSKTAVTLATVDYCKVLAADSVTALAVNHDTVTTTSVTCYVELAGADTLYFDADGSVGSRLLYSGSGLGDMGDLFVPFDNGNFIKVRKRTSSQIYQATARPVYFDSDGTELDMKFVSNNSPNANSTFSVDTDYSSLPYFNPILGSEIATGTPTTVTVYFVAVGN